MTSQESNSVVKEVKLGQRCIKVNGIFDDYLVCMCLIEASIFE